MSVTDSNLQLLYVDFAVTISSEAHVFTDLFSDDNDVCYKIYNIIHTLINEKANILQ